MSAFEMLFIFSTHKALNPQLLPRRHSKNDILLQSV